MHETRNILKKREIYRSFSEKKSLVSSEKREICCFIFTGTVHVVQVTLKLNLHSLLYEKSVFNFSLFFSFRWRGMLSSSTACIFKLFVVDSAMVSIINILHEPPCGKTNGVVFALWIVLSLDFLF